jgi:hypothetical protein
MAMQTMMAIAIHLVIMVSLAVQGEQVLAQGELSQEAL